MPTRFLILYLRWDSMAVNFLPRTAELIEGTRGSLVLRVVDQRKLPEELVFVDLVGAAEVVEALQNMTVRGAPVLGFCGAAALVVWAYNESLNQDVASFLHSLEEVADSVANARPTAINLSREVFKLVSIAKQEGYESLTSIKQAMKTSVGVLASEDEYNNKTLGMHGAELLRLGSRILTHCNAGSLATVFYGTALGVVYSAYEQGKIKRVYIDETRPVGQGARLTTWELSRAGVPGTLLCDNMAASLMQQGVIDVVIVGADRIAANGDTANKIGTYSLAVLARYHDVPFYVAAPLSTFDASTPEGSSIPIEQRSATEVSDYSLEGIDIYNPAFDVTPAHLITHFITEKGVFSPSDLDVLLKNF